MLVRFWRQGLEDQEECYARATVAATRSQSLTVRYYGYHGDDTSIG